jgi:hypothetical protein
MTDAELEEIRVVWRCRGGSYPMPEESVTEAIEALFADHERLRAALLDIGSTRHALAPCATGNEPCPHGSVACSIAGVANAALHPHAPSSIDP